MNMQNNYLDKAQKMIVQNQQRFIEEWHACMSRASQWKDESQTYQNRYNHYHFNIITQENNMVTDQELSQLYERVVQLEDKIAFLYNHLGVTFVPEAGLGDDPRIIE